MAAEGIPVPEIPAQLLFIHQGQKDIKVFPKKLNPRP